MKHSFTIITLFLCSLLAQAQLPMNGWQTHFSYNDVTQIEQSTDKIYAVSGNALFSVDKEDGNIQTYSKLTGLNGNTVAAIKYIPEEQMLIIFYRDGNIDLMDQQERVSNIPDLYNTQSSINKEVNAVAVQGETAYMAMDFGVVALNVKREEIADTYYIGADAQAVDVLAVDVMNDTIYAASARHVYCASIKSNMVDYANWKSLAQLPDSKAISDLACFGNRLYLVGDSMLFRQDGEVWQPLLTDQKVIALEAADEKLFAMTTEGTWVYHLDGAAPTYLDLFYNSLDMAYETGQQLYWFAARGHGVGQYSVEQNARNEFRPDGPMSNIPYRLRFQNGRLFMLQGGYMAEFYERDGAVAFYEDGQWTNYYQYYFRDDSRIGRYTQDYVDVAVDPADKTHFFVASFGYGLIEFRGDEYYKRYMPDNSPLQTMIAAEPEKYTWVESMVYDKEGNLWMLNYTNQGVKVLQANGEWAVISNAATNNLPRTKDLLIDNQNTNRKIIIRTYKGENNGPGIGIFDDNGTIDNQRDDRAATHTRFTDNFGNTVDYEILYGAAQDLDGGLWVGTNNGVIYFDNPANLLESNACRRLTIARTDGSGLADYLFNEEHVTAVAVDGANRVWFGTRTSGVYLMSFADMNNPEEIYHFTVDNSALLSNEILSIAINPNSGEVFIGTSNGLVSFQSDAAEAKEDYSSAYAYPNPVRQDFQGVITIAGLMENSVVKITDNAGNLVCETRSNGGVAVWDGKDTKGRRVRTGVYMAMCLSAETQQHTLVKILIIN